MHEEAEVLDALDWFDENPRELFETTRLRDFHRASRVITLWIRFGPAFSTRYTAALERTGAKASEFESRRDQAALLALRELLPPTWDLLDVYSDPLALDDGPEEAPPRDALVTIGLPGGKNARAATAGAPGIPGRRLTPAAEDEDLKYVGGRPGYVVREADFYKKDWGLWAPHENHVALMEYVVGLQDGHFAGGAEAFAKDLNDKGFKSLEERPFTGASARRVNLARELLRGNAKPGA